MPPDKNSEDGTPSSFDTLSWFDRQKIRAASLFCAVTNMAKEDTKAHPERFPFYAGYLVLLGAAATMSPVPGTTEGIIFLTVGIIHKTKSPWAEWVDRRMKEAFNKESMIERNRRFIEPDKNHEGRLRVKNGGFLMGTFKNVAGNTLGMIAAGFDGIERALTHKPRNPPPPPSPPDSPSPGPG